MPQKNHGERPDRWEPVLQSIAEGQVSLGELATETRIGFDRVAAQFEEVGRNMRETDKRFRQTDERIDKLVLAIGEFIRIKN